MRILDFDFLFTNIPLEETIDIYDNTRFENTERIESSLKREFKEKEWSPYGFTFRSDTG